METVWYLKVAEGTTRVCTILDFMPTPKSQGLRSSLRSEIVVVGPSPDGSEVVERDQTSRTTPQPESRKMCWQLRKLRYSAGTSKDDGKLGSVVRELREHYEKLANAVGKIDRRVGHLMGSA
jgi:hypothetical protein